MSEPNLNDAGNAKFEVKCKLCGLAVEIKPYCLECICGNTEDFPDTKNAERYDKDKFEIKCLACGSLNCEPDRDFASSEETGVLWDYRQIICKDCDAYQFAPDEEI